MSSNAQSAQAPLNDDEIDDLFGDYDIDEPIRDLDTNMAARERPKPTTTATKHIIDDDDDIKITRAKKPRVKLDAERLLSAQGLPKLRRTAPELLGKKLKGKGQEYQDAVKILNFYQLWADDLYRKASFRDTMSIIEKLGHTKRVQIARAEYLNDHKLQDPPDDMERLGGSEEANTVGAAGPSGTQNRDDDDLYAPGPARRVEDDNGDSLFLGGVDDSDSDLDLGAPDDDELAALMSMDNPTTAAPMAAAATTKQPSDDEFDDDFEDDWNELMTPAASALQPQHHGQATTLDKEISNAGPDKSINSIFGGSEPPKAMAEPDEDELEAFYGF